MKNEVEEKEEELKESMKEYEELVVKLTSTEQERDSLKKDLEEKSQ